MATYSTPQWWLIQHGLPTNDIGALYDDGDGMPAWQEYFADTDPMDTNSVLRITTISTESGGLRLQWVGGIEANQYLEGRTNLAATGSEWFVIASNIPPTPISTNRLVNPGNTNVLFYRIRVSR